ncbi:hypothetical protein EYF80_015308 [Liparis tanakae]|uniref:Uncharacterized protein n=1 Tax=Liparis tanakae TaxID=230148 RepID=A0A4Z2I980_9TELE|nr:hypothetical protein EYF80_015308 [Liparis tanakae]
MPRNLCLCITGVDYTAALWGPASCTYPNSRGIIKSFSSITLFLFPKPVERQEINHQFVSATDGQRPHTHAGAAVEAPELTETSLSELLSDSEMGVQSKVDRHRPGVGVALRRLALRGGVFARFGDEGQRCVLSDALDDSIGVTWFREPQQGTREEEVGVIVLGWECLPLRHESLGKEKESGREQGEAGIQQEGGRGRGRGRMGGTKKDEVKPKGFGEVGSGRVERGGEGTERGLGEEQRERGKC